MKADAPVAPVLFDEAFLRRLERLSLRVRRVAGFAGGRPGTLRTPAVDFIDHRAYSPGDDQRHIDWPAAARHDEVFVKVGRAAQAADVHLVLDRSRSMTFDPAKGRLSLELAAALGWMSLSRGDRVTVQPMPAGERAWGPASGGARRADLLGYLAALPADDALSTAVAPAIRESVWRARMGGLLVVLSDLWVADDLDAALSLAPPPRWDALVLHLLAREELEPTLDGPCELVDAESGELVTLVVDGAARVAYREVLNARLERLQAVAARRGASYAVVPGDWPLEQAVVPYLQRRAVLAA